MKILLLLSLLLGLMTPAIAFNSNNGGCDSRVQGCDSDKSGSEGNGEADKDEDRGVDRDEDDDDDYDG